MTQKSARFGTKGKKNVEFVFVDVPIPKQEKVKFDAWFVEQEKDLHLWLEDVVSHGYKLSLSYDLQNDTVIASLTVRDEQSKNYNCCVSGRSPAAIEAFFLVCYKATILLADTSWAEQKQGNSWG